MTANRNSEIVEVNAKQKNTAFPDTIRNSSGVDAYFLRGNPKAPIVQRVGAWIFGALFLLCGVVFANLTLKTHSWAVAVYSMVGFLVGGRIIASGFRGIRWRNHRKQQTKKRRTPRLRNQDFENWLCVLLLIGA
jgi:hypothetical protein